jgi:EamA domain-containing membrane protein RarD
MQKISNIMAEGKSPTLAAIMSLFFAGLGQLYLKKYRRAAVFLALEIATAAVMFYDINLAYVLNLAVSLYASYDAYVLASKTKKVETVKEEDIPVVFIK